MIEWSTSLLQGLFSLHGSERVMMAGILLVTLGCLIYLAFLCVRGIWRSLQRLSSQLNQPARVTSNAVTSAAVPVARSNAKADRLGYVMALGRVGAFLLPLHEMREVPWRVGPTEGRVAQSHQAAVGAGAAAEMAIKSADREPLQIACAWFEDAAGVPQQRLQGLAQFVLHPFLRMVLTSYDRIDARGPELIASDSGAVALSGIGMAADFLASELRSWQGEQTIALFPDTDDVQAAQLRLYLCFSDGFLNTLTACEARFADQHPQYQTYLEQEIVTSWRRFQQHRGTA